jgi:DNA-binding CsgD family transcriptional regulator
VLRTLGLSDVEERVYEALVERARASPAELSAVLDLGSDVVEAALRDLSQRGLVVGLVGPDERVSATAPEPALDALIHEQQHALAQIRAHGQELAARARRAAQERRPEELVAVVVGHASLDASFEQLQRAAEKEMLSFDRPPYPTTGGAAANPLAAERMAAGVVYRTVYDTSLLDLPQVFARVQQEVARGERGRMLSGVPLKMAIADRSMALLPLLDADESHEQATLVIRPSVLLDSLVALFEALWSRAVPFTAAHGHAEVDPELLEIVALLATGMTDERIARQLGTSDRTIRRRIAAALEVLGAETRFQAGLKAAQLGWLASP